MKVKLLLFGEAVTIPHTELGLGVGVLSLWMDGSGFTSATNQIGTLGYIFLETQEVDIGKLDAERQEIFSNLHGRTVTLEVKSTLFVKNGGIARVTLTAAVQQDGDSVERKIAFTADNCRGVSLTTNALSVTCEMLQMEKRLADLESNQIVDDDEVTEVADNAPTDSDNAVA